MVRLDRQSRYDLETARRKARKIMSSFSFPDIDLSMPPGQRLRFLRDSMGLSNKELARRSGVSSTTITNAEKGRLTLRVPTAAKLARFLGISPGFLLIDNGVSGKGELAEMLRNVRYMLGMTQAEFADIIGVNATSVRDWELGERELTDRCRKLIQVVADEVLGYLQRGGY